MEKIRLGEKGGGGGEGRGEGAGGGPEVSASRKKELRKMISKRRSSKQGNKGYNYKARLSYCQNSLC